MITSSNMSHSEFFKLNGTLSLDRIEKLLELEELSDNLEPIKCKIDEASGQFTGEDFLQGVINSVGDLVKRLRGDNKAELLGIMRSLEEIQASTSNSSEYGISELEDALDIIGEWS